jgi:type 1 glutamine amidotransferase/HEAT repeat protein
MNRQVKSITTLFFGIVLCLGAFGTFSASAAERTLKALLVTGQNNHNWQVSSPVLRQILENTGLFTVDVATSPAKTESMDGFKPSFARYDVVVLDYDGKPWPEETQKAFLDYVQSGGGVVVFHAADNAFPDWPEYNKIIGLGGWGNRDEKAGPYLRWKDGGIVRDTSPGSGGSHGLQHEYQVVTRDKEHPIMAGLPEKWMHATDELYSQLRGPAENLTVLATAYADPAQKGTGENEPMLFTINYGKGRIFHTVFGHAGKDSASSPALQCVGFIVTFQRGAEWAATGKVTQKVPADFPTDTQVRLWKNFKYEMSLDEMLSVISGYQFGQGREVLSEMDKYIRSISGSAEAVRSLEKRLVQILMSKDATDAGRQYACEKLSIIGGDASVTTLAAMLTEKARSEIEPADMARYALQRIPGAAAEKALRDAIGKTGGKARVGIINSIGERADKEAVSSLTLLVTGSDKAAAEAAISALGKIGSDKAAAALGKARAKVSPELYLVWADAYLSCGDKFLSEKNVRSAVQIYRLLYTPREPFAVRAAALRGLVEAKPDEAAKLILGELEGKDAKMQAAAIGLFREVPGGELAKAVLSKFDTLSPAGQVQVLSAVGDRGDRTAATVVLKAVGSSEADVRVAALGALGNLGDASNVELLTKTAAGAMTDEAKAAGEALVRLNGEGVDQKILSELAKAPADEKIVLIRSVGQRNIKGGSKVLLKTAGDADVRVRLESLKVLRETAEPGDISAVVELLAGAQTAAERTEAESTAAAVARKVGEDRNMQTAAVLAAFGTAGTTGAKTSLLRVAGRLGGSAALAALTKAVSDGDSEVQTAAIRGLSEWPTTEPLETLRTIAQSSTSKVQKVLALRGFVRLIGLESGRPAAETVTLYQQAMGLEPDMTEKKSVLSGLGRIKIFASLQLAAGCLDDASLAEEAALAAVDIADATQVSHRLPTKAVLEKVLAVSKTEPTRQKAQKILTQIEKQQGSSQQQSNAPGGAVSLIGGDFSLWQDNVETWQVVGEVMMDPGNPKKLASNQGTGVIVNGPNDRTVDICSKTEFGDVQAHIEFMVPQKSNSGVYFMGRYEVQLFDSWGVINPSYSDCGGIYQRWDDKRNPKGYEGYAPSTNASLPAGQWQSFDVTFRAPRFDAAGSKIANAKFEKVILNGIVVHENVEVTGPTRASKFADEKPTGPLMLQGDHGPVAYRNTWIVSPDGKN